MCIGTTETEQNCSKKASVFTIFPLTTIKIDFFNKTEVLAKLFGTSDTGILNIWISYVLNIKNKSF